MKENKAICTKCQGLKKTGLFTFRKCSRCNGTGFEPEIHKETFTSKENNISIKV
jgi:DnaJ-class molecular chaperone